MSSSVGRETVGKKEKVVIVGSGNWGSAIAKIVGENVSKFSDRYEPQVPMWVFEEQVDGQPLTKLINEKHENVKYLPGFTLPENVIAEPDIEKAVEGGTALIFVLPHQFIDKTCDQLKGKFKDSVKGISLIKGVDVQEGQIKIYADVIESKLGIPCCALSGANIANEVASGSFCETTIGYRPGGEHEAKMWAELFQTETFSISTIEDVHGVSLGGALKNVVAMAAGFVDGIGWGNNSKAAIMRIGLLEMKKFSMEFFEGVKAETFTEESAGVADLITSCMGGRNYHCASEFIKSKKSWEDIERDMLNGQKLQGIQTLQEIHSFLEEKKRIDGYPLFDAIYRIAFEGAQPTILTAKLCKL
ncbi:NAD-dependent glycerol-3-phosphate dehydrogenase [Atractiella rhizophila]|nr:NAD-dependent glycerol-3-phosphate dehydrogenase [Atractiella rhizophila]